MRRTAMVMASITVACRIAGAGEPDTLGDAWNKTRQEAKRLAVIGEIKAKLMDQKDIKARYVRVRFDGKTLQLAGFVQSTNIAAEIERIGREVAKPEKVDTYWSVTEGLQDHDPYKTHVQEQASDFAVWLKVRASLASPDVRPLLKNADVQAVDVNHGNVTVFLIVDAPPADVDLRPHIRGIAGVVTFKCAVLTTFAPSVSQMVNIEQYNGFVVSWLQRRSASSASLY